MKSTRSKHDIQSDLADEVEAFLTHGGNISQVERGKSGLSPDKPWINPFKTSEGEKALSRTPLPDVVAAIDARKQSKKKPLAKHRKPKKTWIFDDFGEPVRWVWSEESTS
ncbi:MAG: hypothetical protein ACI9PX_000510 [Reinekea sp.]|jgi:hypothetical protein